MTVLHLISSGGLYGAEAVILNLSRRLNESAEHKSVLAVFANAGSSNAALERAAAEAGVELHLIPCAGQIDRRVPRRLRELIRHAGADVLHAHGYKADVYAAVSLRGAHRPRLVSTCHTWYDNDLSVRFYGFVDRLVLRGFNAVVAVSEDVRGRLLASGVRAERIHIIRNGVNLTPFVAAGRQRLMRGDSKPLRVGLVGRLAPEKGVDVFFRAVKQLLQARPSLRSEAGFEVAGEGPQREDLAALRRELGLDDLVALRGRCEDMPGFYASLDILVSASRQEGLPVALLEGMASGLPLVATAVGEVPSLARGNTTALLVPPEDPVALGRAIAQLIDRPELRVALGTAGQQLIAEEYSADAMTTEYLRVYAGKTSDLFAEQGTALSGRAG